MMTATQVAISAACLSIFTPPRTQDPLAADRSREWRIDET